MPAPGKILIVDDEAHVRKFVSLIARSLGQPAIIEAGDGKEALAKYTAEAPDLVLLDVNMPVLDGVHTLAALLKQDAKAKVIMLTSLANRQTIEKCINAGAAGYIRKDTPRESILTELTAIVRETFGEN
ncbi:MAG TPA: response regulator transcription factor [Alphaproteobacteria bacterium]|nr:response regulator transcription factor [Alphaproteobacteria bacterium]